MKMSCLLVVIYSTICGVPDGLVRLWCFYYKVLMGDMLCENVKNVAVKPVLSNW